MRAWYGAGPTHTEVTNILLSMQVGGIIDMSRVIYNDIFGDPNPGVLKKLTIEDPVLAHPIMIGENTPFVMNINGIDIDSIPINIVYFINTTVNPTYYFMMESQLNDLKSSGLLLLSNVTVYVEVIVKKEDTQRVLAEIESLIPSAIVHPYEEDFFEYPGIHRVWCLSQINPNNITLYFHSKGISHIPQMSKTNCRSQEETVVFDLVIRRWRHNIAVLHLFPSINKVGHSADICGWIWNNFWWARGTYLAEVEEPCKTRRRHYYEDWLCRKMITPLRYSNIERPFIPSIYNMSYNDCYGYYCNSPVDHVNVGGILRLDQPVSHPIPSGSRKLMKIDIGTPGRGLFNQINNLVNALIIGNKTGRDIHNPMFCPDLRSLDSIPWSHIIDVDYLNKYLGDIGISTRIIYDNRKIEWSVCPCKDHMCFYHLAMGPIVKSVLSGPTHLDVGCGYLLMMDEDLGTQIIKNLRLSKPCQDVVDYCLSTIGEPFNCVHFRLEDDWMDRNVTALRETFEGSSTRSWNSTVSSMDALFNKDDKIFLATHLMKSNNVNNYMVEKLRLLYPNIRLSPNWREKFHLPVGREIDALIDYMICSRCSKFIGRHGSTFSMAVGMLMNKEGKPHIIIPDQQ